MIVFPSLQIGKDKLGNCYWFQVDPEASVRVYREDLDDETWELVASNRFVFVLWKTCHLKPPPNEDVCVFYFKSLPFYPETYHYPQRDELAALVELLTDKETFARTVSQEEMEEEDSMQGLEDIIRDTGPVDSNLTSANASKYNSEVGLSNDLKDLDGDDEDHADNGWINIDVI